MPILLLGGLRSSAPQTMESKGKNVSVELKEGFVIWQKVSQPDAVKIYSKDSQTDGKCSTLD